MGQPNEMYDLKNGYHTSYCFDACFNNASTLDPSRMAQNSSPITLAPPYTTRNHTFTTRFTLRPNENNYSLCIR